MFHCQWYTCSHPLASAKEIKCCTFSWIYCTPQCQACRWIKWENGIIFSTIPSTVENIIYWNMDTWTNRSWTCNKRAIRQPQVVCTHKQNKITASICKDVISHMNNSNSKMPTNLIKRITTKGTIYEQVSYSQAELFNYKTKGMIYGIENEPVAASLYKSHLHHYRMSRKSQFRRLALFWTKMIQFLLQALTELQPLSTIMAMLSSEMLR